MLHDTLSLSYQLRFISGFHCGTGLRQGLIHRGVARDADGFLYVPGSTLKGILRDHATSIARLLKLDIPLPHAQTAGLDHFATTCDVVAHIFGSVFRPGTLFFDDALMHQEDRKFFNSDSGTDKEHTERFRAQQIDTRTQVSMSRVTGTARRGMLFSSEYGIRELRFCGTIQGRLSGVPTIDDATTSYSLVLLLAALCSLDRIGGGKSTGFGHVVCHITHLSLNNDTPYSGDTATEKVAACLALLPELELYLEQEKEVSG